MSLIRAIKTLFAGAGHWIQETYCAMGQHVAEQIETASDAIAEQRYRAEHGNSSHESVVLPKHKVIELKPYGVINGHKHPN
jgi:hypothetical protein